MVGEKIVSGYSFQNLDDANLARQEQKKIEYIEARLDYQNPSVVLKIYEKAVNENLFRTPVGYEFMKKLYDYLRIHIGDADLMPVPLQQPFAFRMRNSYSATPKRVIAGTKKKQWPVISVILNIILVMAVIGMFIIAVTGDNPNILNYEKALTNRYASWEQEISQREKAVKEKERALLKESDEVESGRTE